MPSRAASVVLVAALLLASCGPGAATFIPQETPVPPAQTAAPRADVIRFALVGEVHLTNVWAYFDEAGADYNNRAVQANFWPSLYRLSIPNGEFESYLADGMPPAFEEEDGFFAADVALSPGLLWSDGTPLTAEDVAFTVNAALAFELGLDWGAAYHPAVLDRAEAVDDLTVRFYFKSRPTVADWQYGALQGPIVSAAYWESKVAALTGLLPSPELEQSILDLQAEAETVQTNLDDLTVSLSLVEQSSKDYEKLKTQVDKKQAELNYLNSEIERLGYEREAILVDARTALYALDSEGEPTFGPYMAGPREAGVLENVINPQYPFNAPAFERVVYVTFPEDALTAESLTGSEVDVLLDPAGLSSDWIARLSEAGFAISKQPTSSARFLVLNPSNPHLADRTFRRALGCIVENTFFLLGVEFEDLQSFVLPDNLFWNNAQAVKPCAGLDPQDSFDQIITILKSGGYGWDREPVTDAARPGLAVTGGSSLKLPDGEAFPPIGLLVSSSDPRQGEFAEQLVERLRLLGLDVDLQAATPQEVNYAVYSNGDYDMVILGWRLSAYPGYLCEWFEAPSPFAYDGDRLKSACEAMRGAGDLEKARESAFEVQSVLVDDLPFVPLYAGFRYEAYRMDYPFDRVLNGIVDLYGAPWLAADLP
ncbi:MAG: ABC transporter substrate-binding protein [Chloroflexota bacterium]